MNLFYHPNPTSTNVLSRDDSRHAIKVLRLKEGDKLDITDGKGTFYSARIKDADASGCAFIVAETRQQPARNFHVHIAIAPTKNADRTEWFIEKAVEIGIEEISFVACKNSERRTLNMERVEKVAISAMKQSQRAWLPKLNAIAPFTQLLQTQADQKFVAFVDQSNPSHLKDLAKQKTTYLVLIGPEGDFSPEELKAATHGGFEKVSLGPSRLRTETAALAACHILNLVNT